jgi:DNA modification methylase
MRLQDCLLAELPKKANPPSEAKIKAIVHGLLEQISDLDQKYKKWQSEQRSVEQAQEAQEAVALARLAMEQEYQPIGFAARLETISLELDTYDAIATEYSPEDFPPRWLAVVEALKPGGVLICTCLNDDIFDLHLSVQQSELHYLETLIWLRPDPSPSERFASGFEFIYVAAKPGLIPYFDADRVRTQFPQCSLTNAINFIAIDPGERIDGGSPVKLAEFLLTAYVPPKGNVLNPFARSASFTRAAKRLGCKATWVEPDPRLFAKAEALIEQAPFAWE